MQFNQIANNSIQNYNKLFSQNLESFNIASDKNGIPAFDNVLNQQMQQTSMNSQVINGGIQLNVGLENMGITPIDTSSIAPEYMSTKKVESSSPVEKTVDDFAKAFSDGLNSVNDSQHAAYEAAETFASGGDISVHEVMLASQKANLTMQMAIQLRNKLINAYNELYNVRI